MDRSYDENFFKELFEVTIKNCEGIADSIVNSRNNQTTNNFLDEQHLNKKFADTNSMVHRHIVLEL